MIFYVIANGLIGLFGGNATDIYRKSRNNSSYLGQLPMWAFGTGGAFVTSVCFLAMIAAVITSFVNFGLMFGLITIVEIFVGAALASVLPLTLRVLLFAVSPIIILIIMGALWGLWFI